MNATDDPRAILDNSPMTLLQFVIVGLTVLLNAMDGFDVLVIAVSASGIAEEWGLDRAALGFVVTAELFGMAIGSLVFGGAADKYGRRFTLLFCLTLMAGGMLAATTANNPYMLCLWRILTGLGIGGMLSCTNAVVAEFSNRRNRALCISLMVIGYPLGGIAVSLLAENVLVAGS